MAGVAIGAFAGIVGAGFLARANVVSLKQSFPYVRVAFDKRNRPVHCKRGARVGAVQGGLSVPPEKYPDVARSDVVDVLHGEKVPDPYRWLEDPGSEETKKFVEEQNKLTHSILEGCASREQLKEMLSAVMDHEKRGIPWRRGDRWYYYYNSGLQNQYVLYTCDAPEAEGKVFFDPNLLSEDGTVSLGTVSFSPDGSVMAYALASGGSDWNTISALRVAADGSPEPLTDRLEHVKFSSISWTLDGKGFFYNRFDKPATVDGELGTETDTNVNQKLYYHVLGTPQEDDVWVFATPEHPTWMSGAHVSDDGRWLWLSLTEGCEPCNRAYVCDLATLERTPAGAIDFSKYTFDGAAPRLRFIKLVDDFRASYRLVCNEGSVFTLKTNLNATRYRLVRVDVLAKQPKFEELLPEHPKDLLQSCTALQGDLMIVQWMRDVQDVAEVRRISDGSLIFPFTLPTIGTMSGITTEPRRSSREVWFSLTTFVEPGAIYRATASDTAPPEPRLFHRTELKIPHNPDEFVTKQVFVKSKDGTKVPMFVVHHKDIALDGSNPTLLYGYGGFSVSLQPSFSASRLVWLKAFNGVFVMANLRGGGEYGRSWRDDGSKLRKQNVFDDFQACAQHLIDGGFCSPATLTIQGGSNGGLLVAACVNQRPDLFGCVLAQVGVMDMLRFHKFTIGHAWCSDYGSPDDAEMFHYLKRSSPLHNTRLPSDGGQYPAVLLTTGDHDDRVVPLHSLKFLAQLQHTLIKSPPSPAQRNPIVARIEVRAGHGAGKPTAKVIEEIADMWAFAAAATGAKFQG